MAEDFKLATAGDDIKIWDLKSFSVTDQYNPHSSGISDICWSHNNQLIASASTCTDKVVLSFVKTKASPVIQVAENSKPTCVTLNSNSRYLASAGKNQLVQVWDTKSCKLKKTYRGHQDTVNCVRFNWNDTYLASGSANGEIYLHSVVSGVAIKPLVSPGTQSIQQVGYSYFKKSLLASVSDDGALNMWDTNASKCVATFTDSHRAPATALSFSPVNDMLLASAGLDKRIVCYSVQAKSTIKTFTADAPLTSMAFATDGATLAAGTTRGKVLVYDLRMGALPIKVLSAHKTSVQTVAFSKATNNKSDSSDVKAPSTASTRSKLIAGEPQVTSVLKNGMKPGKQINKEALLNGSATRQAPPDTTNKDQSTDVLFSPVREATAMPSKDTLSNGFSTRPEVLGKASAPRTDSLGGVFSPLGDTVPYTRGNPVGSVSLSPTSYLAKQPIINDVILSGGASGPSTPTGLSPRSRNTGLSPRSARKSPGRSSVGSLDLDTTQFRVNPPSTAENSHMEKTSDRPSTTAASSRVEISKPEESSTRPGVISGSNKMENTGRLEDSSRRPPGITNKVNNIDSKNGISTRLPADPQVPPAISSTYTSSSAHSSGPTGDVAPERSIAALSTNQPPAGLNTFQVDFIKNMIDDSLEEFRDSIHRDVRNLQLEMLRQFQIHKMEMKEMLEHYSVNEGLLSEIERLREENKRLKNTY
ncbi:protein NEDD1-like [Antedon mediterranea]|uniref:protein NEDD1-like n=1 Tax=Antedon mediterranea TaxID=105859 RepID=UPI003AF64C3A